MPCFHPLTGYRTPGGQVSFATQGPWVQRTTVACGSCVGCKAERTRQWAVRGMHELQMSTDGHPTNPLPRACFITLTYADEHLPENSQLVYRDWQLFAKKLRQKTGGFRFLMCGEYGDPGKTERPHFHAIIFGCDFSIDRTPSHKTAEGHQLYLSPTLDKIWNKGFHTIGSVSHDSIAYCASYINKKVTGDKAQAHYERVNTKTGEVFNQVPEFGNMSRNPGLGSSWIEKYHAEVYPRDEVLFKGKPATPPAFYDRWYAERFPEAMEAIKQKRVIKALKHAENNTRERLATREKVFKAGYSNYQLKKANR